MLTAGAFAGTDSNFFARNPCRLSRQGLLVAPRPLATASRGGRSQFVFESKERRHAAGQLAAPVLGSVLAEMAPRTMPPTRPGSPNPTFLPLPTAAWPSVVWPPWAPSRPPRPLSPVARRPTMACTPPTTAGPTAACWVPTTTSRSAAVTRCTSRSAPPATAWSTSISATLSVSATPRTRPRRVDRGGCPWPHAGSRTLPTREGAALAPTGDRRRV